MIDDQIWSTHHPKSPFLNVLSLCNIIKKSLIFITKKVTPLSEALTCNFLMKVVNEQRFYKPHYQNVFFLQLARSQPIGVLELNSFYLNIIHFYLTEFISISNNQNSPVSSNFFKMFIDFFKF